MSSMMHTDAERLLTAYEQGRVSRRAFLGALAAAALAPRALAQGGPPIPVTALNHVTIGVSDPARSLAWYQGLFGLPIAARQANTVILRVGDGPQFLAIGGGSSANPGIGHFCLSVDNFDADRLVGILGGHGVASSQTSGPMEVRIRMRGAEFGGAPEGTPELYFGDPDGVVVQLQDSTYCGGEGVLGDVCPETPEPAPTEGLLHLRDYNHFTIFVTDQQRSMALYQQLFGLPVDTYQGALPVLRVGSGNQFLALAGAGGGPTGPIIHHASFAVDDFDVDRILGVLVRLRGHAPRRGVGSDRSVAVVRDDAHAGPRRRSRRHPGALLHRSGRHPAPASGRAVLRRQRLSRRRVRHAGEPHRAQSVAGRPISRGRSGAWPECGPRRQNM